MLPLSETCSSIPSTIKEERRELCPIPASHRRILQMERSAAAEVAAAPARMNAMKKGLEPYLVSSQRIAFPLNTVIGSLSRVCTDS